MEENAGKHDGCDRSASLHRRTRHNARRLLLCLGQVVPAPTLSPLEDGYVDELKRVAAALNGVQDGAVTVHEFDSMGCFAEIMRGLINETQPYTLFAK